MHDVAWFEKLKVAPLMSRTWSMPSKWTFAMNPVKEILNRYAVGAGWIEPFAGKSKWGEVRNDLNPASECDYHMPALDFLKSLPASDVYKGIVWDPPYSIHQVKVSYDSFGLSVKDNITGGFPKEKDEVARILQPGALGISFGWHTGGFGKGRGFAPIEYLIISHGGNRNDTLVTVEVKCGQV